jgi:hypothetical protein
MKDGATAHITSSRFEGNEAVVRVRGHALEP